MNGTGAGGIGVTEASMVGFLTSAARLNADTTVAAVAIFRIVAIVIPALVGAVVYYFFWKGEEEVDGRVPPVLNSRRILQFSLPTKKDQQKERHELV